MPQWFILFLDSGSVLRTVRNDEEEGFRIVLRTVRDDRGGLRGLQG